MNHLFETLVLNADGLKKANRIASEFAALLDALELTVGPEASKGRAFSIAKTKLEEACHFAKKAMAQQPENQVP